MTQHYYAVVASGANFDDALKRSGESSYAGVQGYLFVPDSYFELLHVLSTIVQSVTGGNIWLGFTDKAVEGKYLIAAGPNAGTDASDVVAWQLGEQSGGTNDNCVMYVAGYTWYADMPCSSTSAYVIEYECPFGQRFNDQGTACIGTLRTMYQ